MKKLVLPTTCALLLLYTSSCINTEREVGNSKNSQQIFSPSPEGSRNRVSERTVLRTVNTTHYFSNAKTKDNFILQLRGPKIATAQAYFIIVRSTGDTLRKEVMPATALINERDLADPRAATVRDKEIAILQGMNSFFATDRFVQPAIPRTSAQPENVDVQSWSSVKEDTRSIGFDYTASEGRERRLAFSKKLGRAVIVAE
ncbi:MULTISPECIES: hypothetical protein [Hymenobacter]|uniref:Uncharacterized protein n=1 Tax=Hymenobacter mucosus TaxID=1411120 RepID=A0A238VCI1_9BACT|nr:MULTISPECIES: hypothetical protein [Hymenobacter]SNR31229.1 hypothetical protein SAMN06269173_101352 [Hymenobacter mucosus]